MIEVRRERSRVTKTPQTQRAGVRVEPHERMSRVEFTLLREELEIERIPITRRPSRRSLGGLEPIRVELREERANIVRRPLVREELSVRREPRAERRRVDTEERREEPILNRRGDARVNTEGSTKEERK